MDEDEVTAIVRSLARYLRAHPLACDSASGIAQWWLQPDDDVSMDALMRALDWLKRCDVVEDTAGSDGRTRYRRRCDDQALDAAVAARDTVLRRTP
jgi:hypothetical protein